MAESPVYVSLEFTPNPNTLKYSVNRTISEIGALSFSKEEFEKAEKDSPLATRILGFDGISEVMFGRDFVTVTKSDDGDWDQVHQNVSELIESHLTDSQPVLSEELSKKKAQREFSDIELQIVEFLDSQIRPAVAMDGGDISFDRFEDGRVFVQLQGACSGCPSSTMTLKMGIEERLRQMIPEVKEVVAV